MKEAVHYGSGADVDAENEGWVDDFGVRHFAAELELKSAVFVFGFSLAVQASPLMIS